MQLYEYAVYYPGGDDRPPTILANPKAILADDEDAVKRIAIREVSDDWEEVLGDLKVVVRPFCRCR